VPKVELDASVKKLLELKAALQEATAASRAENAEETRRLAARKDAFEQLMLRKLFVVPSFEIYGGVAGLYDFGPPGTALMNQIQTVWRNHFVLAEQMLEISCPAMTPERVLEVSGHVEKFQDLMVRDTVNLECHRADHLLEDHIDKMLAAGGLTPERDLELRKVRGQADAYSPQALGEQLAELKVQSPDGNALGEPFPFNLMFKTEIGPTGKQPGFLRPETAQGIFVAFRRLLEFNAGRLPFAAAQIGAAYRNEIAPRGGLLRVREFALAEIEHFVHPREKAHPGFAEVAGLRLNLLDRGLQMEARGHETRGLGEAVAQGLIDNESLGYFIGRTFLFLTSIGVDPARLRFRQHLADEMAHYATDCWDAEIETHYGWVECVGHADRSCFDLERHSRASGVELSARIQYDTPREEERVVVEFNKREIDKAFRKDAKDVMAAVSGMADADVLVLQERLTGGAKEQITAGAGQKSFELAAGMFTAERKTVPVTGETFYPSVIEPSFGLGRIMYCVLEHCFDTDSRDEESRVVLKLPSLVAPYKLAVLTLSNNAELNAIGHSINRACSRSGISTRTDFSNGSIGRKYARTEELGVPFGITVDFASVKTGRVTLRDRDSTQQIYLAAEEVPTVVRQLADGSLTWAQVWATREQVQRPGE